MKPNKAKKTGGKTWWSTIKNDPAEERNALFLDEYIQVTEYAPDVFAFLRVLDGYDNLNLHKSFDPEANRD